jgi:hypothetical protein
MALLFLCVPAGVQISTGKDTALSALILSEGLNVAAGFPAGCADFPAGGGCC